MLVAVSPSLNIHETLTYRYTGDPGDIGPGSRVIIPLARRVVSGWVVDLHSTYKGRVKNIIGIVEDDYIPDARCMEFVHAVSGIYFTSMGQLLDSALPPGKKATGGLYLQVGDMEKPQKIDKFAPGELEKMARPNPLHFFFKNPGPADDPTDSPRPPVSSTEGPEDPVGSDRTFLLGYERQEYYARLVERYLARGESVLIAVPDGLTARYLQESLPGVDLYTSDVKPKERDRLWQAYARGKVGVVVGGLSAVLLPVEKLGLVICERAGSALYKKRFFSKYDVAVLAGIKARTWRVPLVEGYPTLTVEAYKRGRSVVIEDNRGERDIPLTVHMLTVKDKGIPASLMELLKGRYMDGKKILVVLNRKESSCFLFCSRCAKIQKCPRCSGLLKVGEDSTSVCTRCGTNHDDLTVCPKCSGALSLLEDISIASLKKAVGNEVVGTGIHTLSAAGLKDEKGLLKQIETAKIVISTPVIVNPYFKDRFDTVVYVRPESLFNMDAYNAAEMIYTTLWELKELVKDGGSIEVFSSFHFHYALRLCEDEGAFFERELKYREWFRLPPFANVYHIEIRERDLRKLGRAMRTVYGKHKDALGIGAIYLASRKKIAKGNYKGVIEAHAEPGAILESGLVGLRNTTVEPVMV